MCGLTTVPSIQFNVQGEQFVRHTKSTRFNYENFTANKHSDCETTTNNICVPIIGSCDDTCSCKNRLQAFKETLLKATCRIPQLLLLMWVTMLKAISINRIRVVQIDERNIQPATHTELKEKQKVFSFRSFSLPINSWTCLLSVLDNLPLLSRVWLTENSKLQSVWYFRLCRLLIIWITDFISGNQC